MTHLPLRGSLAPLTMPGKVPSSLLSGIVAYWKLDESSGTRADSVGSNSLTSVNNVAQATGIVGSAAQFTAASSQRLTRADNTDLSTGNTDFTFAGWFYLDSLPAANAGLIEKDDLASNREYDLVLNNVNQVTWFVFDSSSGNVNVILGAPALTVGTWVHLICWYDTADKKVRIQKNNGSVSASSGALTNGPKDGAATFELGARNAASFYSGRIDEVGFWKRLLTTAEKTALYNGGSGLTYPFS